MSTTKRVLTSTVEMGRPTIIVRTPEVESQFTRTDFIQTLKKVSRRVRSKPSEPAPEASET